MMHSPAHPPRLRIEFAQCSDPGRDPNKQVNEDSCGYAETKFGHLCVVCDGMGGHYGGKEASRAAITTIFEIIEQTAPAVPPAAALKSAIEEAGRRVYRLGGPVENRTRPGSTVVAMVLHDRGVDIAHVGDSRAFIIRSNQIYPLTRDHSMVQGMIDAGMLTETQAIGHPDANKITRALGMKPEVEVEVRPEPMELYPGDVLLMASDGLTDLVLSADILGCTRQALASGSVEHACKMLVQLANDRGGHDNITVQMVRVLEAGGRSPTLAQGPPGTTSKTGSGEALGLAQPQETIAMTRADDAPKSRRSPILAIAAHAQPAHAPPAHGQLAYAPAPLPGPTASWGPVPPTATELAKAVSPTATDAPPGVHPTAVDPVPGAAGTTAPDTAAGAGPTPTDGPSSVARPAAAQFHPGPFAPQAALASAAPLAAGAAPLATGAAPLATGAAPLAAGAAPFSTGAPPLSAAVPYRSEAATSSPMLPSPGQIGYGAFAAPQGAPSHFSPVSGPATMVPSTASRPRGPLFFVILGASAIIAALLIALLWALLPR